MKLQLEQLFGNGGIDAISAMARQMAFDALFEKLPISFYWMDKNGILLGCNDNVLTALGLQSTDQLIGKHSNELVTEEAWLNSKHVIETEKPVVFEEESYSQNDSKNITYLSIKSPIFNDDGSEVIGLLGVSIDITDRKNMEKELQIAKGKAEESDHLKTEFIRNIEHDIRTPFAGIASLASILLLREKEESERKTFLDAIVKSTQRLLDYCNNIIEFVLLGEKTLADVVSKEFDLRALICEIIEIELPPALHKKIDLLMVYPDDIPKCLVSDYERLKRILLNLVSNAIKFTNQGYVKISVDIVGASLVGADEKMMVQIDIEDTGSGIPADKQKTVFERFVRLGPAEEGVYKSTGLGLSVVKQLVEALSGRIELKSEVGKGSTFTCMIPMKKCEEATSNNTEPFTHA